MVNANAEITKAAASRDHRVRRLMTASHRRRPWAAGLRLPADHLQILAQLTGRGISWLTLRQRSKAELERLAAPLGSAWKTVTIARTGRHQRPCAKT